MVLDIVCVGRIHAPHGLKGAVRIESYTENPRDIFAFGPFVRADGSAFLTLDRVLSEDPPRSFLILVKEAQSRTMADTLKGQALYVLREQLPPLKDETFYHRDLLGLRVMLNDVADYGIVQSVDNFGAGDLLEIAPHDKATPPFWLPFRARYVPEVKVSEGYIRVDLGDWEAAGLLKPT